MIFQLSKKVNVSKNPEQFLDGYVHEIISGRKTVWPELLSRTNNSEELKFKQTIIQRP